MPMPRAAVTVARSTWRMPTKALVRIGGMPSTASATVNGTRPTPTTAAIRAISASSGIARPALPSATAKVSPTPRCPR